MDQFAVHGQRRYTDIDGTAEVSFLLGGDGRLPVIDAGIPAAVLLLDPHLVWKALRQLALEFHRAQVGQPDTAVVVILDPVHARVSQERPRAGTVLLLEAGPGSSQFGIAPVLIRSSEITRRALGHELADLGGVLHPEPRLMLQVVELFLQLHGTGPEPVDLGTGRLVDGDHQVEDRTGNAHRTGGVLFLPGSEVDRHLDASLEPTIGAGAALIIACFGHRGICLSLIRCAYITR